MPSDEAGQPEGWLHTDPVQAWIEALEARHLADLRPAEAARALTALSSVYVERRARLARGAALDSRGKRAAFALFYGPLHFFTVRAIVRALDAAAAPIETLLDLGCGTGAAGAAWASAFSRPPIVQGVDRHPWAAEEATWTYHQFGLSGRARVGDAAGVRRPRGRTAILAAYLVNELRAEAQPRLRDQLLAAASRGTPVLIVEPIARRMSPWWPQWQEIIEQAGGRADEWRFAADLPASVKQLGRAAGLDYRELTARTLWIGQQPAAP